MASLLRGAPGTLVGLTVIRPAAGAALPDGKAADIAAAGEAVFDFRVRRESLKIETVSSRSVALEDGRRLGVVRVKAFGQVRRWDLAAQAAQAAQATQATQATQGTQEL